MISNERRSFSGQRYHAPSGHKPHVDEKTLKTESIQIERKTFVFTLRENPRGPFLRITEDVGGRRDNIIVPATGLPEFHRVLGTMIQAVAELPPSPPSAEPLPPPPPAPES
jgi:hypothetical protein